VLADGFGVAEVEEGDISRIAELVEQYVSLPLGIVDATVIAIAERLNLTEVATVDRERFSIVRPKHVPRSGSSPRHSRSTDALRRRLLPARSAAEPPDHSDKLLIRRDAE
jgi:hypothetical protein